MQSLCFDFEVKDTPEVQPLARRSRRGGMRFGSGVLRPCALISAIKTGVTTYFNGVSLSSAPSEELSDRSDSSCLCVFDNKLDGNHTVPDVLIEPVGHFDKFRQTIGVVEPNGVKALVATLD